MMHKGFKFSMIFSVVAVLVCLTSVHASAVQGNNGTSTVKSKTNILLTFEEPIYYPMLQESLVDRFERASVAPWLTSGDTIWAIRDTTDVYGPDTALASGYRYAGHPDYDLPEYPSSGGNPGLMAQLTSPTLDLTGWDSLFISFNYWGDFEGTATNFDGMLLFISTDLGVTWRHVDSAATGHLNPTYDSRLAGTTGGQLYDSTAWAYCHDTKPNWVSVGSQNLMNLGYVAEGDQVAFRFTFVYDALDGGQGIFVDNIRVATVQEPDIQPPEITHTPLVDTPDSVNNYTISATVVDLGSNATGVDPDSVYLYYQIESGPETATQMINTGGDTYEAQIPAQTYHTDIYYHIEAADLAIPPNLGSSLEASFEVTNALTIIYDNNQPYSSIGGLAQGDGLFNFFDFSDVGIDSGQIHKAMFYFSGLGNFDIRLYRWTGSAPGTLLDEIAGLASPGYAWYVQELDAENIHASGGCVVGYIIGPMTPDTITCLTDPALTYPSNSWGYINSAWQQTPAPSAGDLMIRIKVIPEYPAGIEDAPSNQLKKPFALKQISSNPMINHATLEYQLPTEQHVWLSIYDITGKLIRSLVDVQTQAGTHQVTWNGCDTQGKTVANGVYFYQLKGENQSLTGKLVLTH